MPATKRQPPALEDIARELVQSKEAASMLGMTHSGLRWYADTGRLPCLRLESGERLYRRTDLEKLVREREKKGR